MMGFSGASNIAQVSTLYEILGVTESATQDEIKAAYRRLATKAHPDVGGSAALFRLVQEAHETLSDSALRLSYDRGLTAENTRVPTEAEKRRSELIKARSSFLYFAEGCNGAIAAAWAAVPAPGPSWKDYPRLYALSAEADRQFAQAVAGYQWPLGARDAALALVSAVAVEAGKYVQCSLLPGTRVGLARTLAEIQRAERATTIASTAMRAALGLPEKA